MWTLVLIALRNVLRNRRRTLITMASLVVGVGVTVCIQGLLAGLQEAAVQTVVDGQTGGVQIHRKGFLENILTSPLNLSVPADEAFLARVRAVPHVTGAAAHIQFPGMLNVGDETLFMATLAVDPQGELAVCPLRQKTLAPGTSLPGRELADGVVVTTELARAVSASKGEQGALLAPDIDGSLSGENVHLAGTMNLNLPGEKKVGLVPLAVAQRLLKMEGKATELIVGVDKLERAPEVAQALRAALGPDYEVQTWDEIAWYLKQNMARQKFIAGFVVVVFTLLMLLGVANTMLMSVLERTREIGTMMAVGVRRGQILALIVLESLGIGALGAALGGLVGTGICLLLSARGIVINAPASSIPFLLKPVLTAAYLAKVVLIGSVGAGLFGLYPAFRASRLRPVEALAGQ